MARTLTIVIFFCLLCAFYWFFVMKGSPLPFGKKKTPQRRPTMFDVRRLLQEGDREGATKLYIQIFKVSGRKAKKDIEDLERNLKV